jgi:hypothetical protein
MSVALVTVDEFDIALAAGKASFGRLNYRDVRCAIMGCRKVCGPGEARKLFIDGHRRGMACVERHVPQGAPRA